MWVQRTEAKQFTGENKRGQIMFTITLKAVRCFLRPELAAWGRGRVEANSRHRTRLHVCAVGEMQKQLHAMESIQLNVRGIPVEAVEIRPNHR